MIGSTPPGSSHVRETDLLFRALSDRHRRIVLHALGRSRSANLHDLAAEIVRRENDQSIDDLPPEAVRAVRIDLHHRHVPLLVDAGLIDRTEGGDAIAVSEGALVEACLETLNAVE